MPASESLLALTIIMNRIATSFSLPGRALVSRFRPGSLTLASLERRTKVREIDTAPHFFRVRPSTVGDKSRRVKGPVWAEPARPVGGTAREKRAVRSSVGSYGQGVVAQTTTPGRSFHSSDQPLPGNS
jgi:hypothetical protein